MKKVLKNKFLIFLFAFFCVVVQLHSSNINQQNIYRAFIAGNWKAWITEIQVNEAKKTNDLNQKLFLIELYYGYSGFLLSKKNYDEVEKLILKADKLISSILNSEPKNSTALAFKGSFTGFKIPINRLKILQLGNESFRYVNLAYEIDNNNIQALTDRGSALFFTPKLFGGNKSEAIKHFEKAISILEKTNNTAYNWKYMNLLTLLARCYDKTDQKKKAANTYEKILKLEPDFLWVSKELYPAFLKSLKK